MVYTDFEDHLETDSSQKHTNRGRDPEESRMRGSFATRVLGFFLLGLEPLLCPPIVGQVIDKTFEEKTDVIEVQVPVNINARDGTPVRDLGPEDFTILDNGKQQEIVGFQVVDLDAIEPGPTRLEIERSVPAAARRHFLLLFDLSFSAPSSILRAREAARAFVVNELHPTDLAAVAMHTVETGGRILVTFTPDRAQIARAIDTLGAPRLLQLARRDPLRFMIDDPGLSGFQASQALGGGGDLAGLQQSVVAHIRVIANEMAKTEKSFDRGRVSSWSRSMGDLARFMDSVKGRKHVVYFTEGFDGRLLFGRTPSADDADYQQDLMEIQTGQYWMVDTDDLYGNASLQSDVHEMLEEFQRADCIIQAVDISGLTAGTPAEERNRDATQAALFYIANDTGGELFQDANDFGDQLGKVLQRTSVTYLLTFRPSKIDLDGSFHRLKVKADAPGGSRLSHRKGYYAPRPYEQLHPFEKSLLASDAIASATERRDVAVNVLSASFRSGADRAYVPVIIEVDGRDLLAGHEETHLPVELYAYASNEHGEMKDFFTQAVTLDLTRSRKAFHATGLKYYGHLNLPAGEYMVRVLVRNGTTGVTGVEVATVTVPAYAAAEPFLLPPFFVETNKQWFLVRESTGEEHTDSVVYPFTVNGEPYIPAALPDLQSQDEARICLVGYNLGEGDLLVNGTIVAEDGTIVEAGVLDQLERTITGIDGLDKLLATFRPDGLEAGRYTLEVALRNVASGDIETNSIPFTLGISN